MKISLTKRKLYILAAVAFALPMLLLAAMAAGSREQADIKVTSCLPAFRDGGGPYYLPDSPFRAKLAPDGTEGKELVVEGYLLNTDCSQPVAGAVIDIWQADHTGEYRNDYFRGQIYSGVDGSYRFETVLPKGYGDGTGYRPPHIHFKVFVEGKEIVTSQMFFSDVTDKAGFNNEYIIATQEQEGRVFGNYNIVLPDFP